MTENETPTLAAHDDARSRRNRIMGKLFGRGQKSTADDGSGSDLNDFLHGPSDKLQVTHASPPVLTRLDTKSASRYPNALDIQSGEPKIQEYPIRPRDPARRGRKDLIVRFADTYPEMIGEGGDECDIPTIEVSRQKKQRSQPSPGLPPGRPPNVGEGSPSPFPPRSDSRSKDHPMLSPGLHQSQTGLLPSPDVTQSRLSPVNSGRYLGMPSPDHEEKRRSYLEMREAEGRAFANAVRAASGEHAQRRVASPSTNDREKEPAMTTSPTSIPTPRTQLSTQSTSSMAPPASARSPLQNPLPSPLPQRHADQREPTPSQASYTPTSQYTSSPERMQRNQNAESTTPPSAHSQGSAFNPPGLASQGSNFSTMSMQSPSGGYHPFGPSRQGTRDSDKDYTPGGSLRGGSSFSDVVAAASDDALNTFVARTRHLFELFRLHAEAVRPLSTSQPQEFARAAVWWFLTGRSALEMAIRDRPSTPDSQRKNEMMKQQAYTDLAKGYWLLEEAMPEIINSGKCSVDSEAENVRASLISSLRKLALSMKRNGFLPPEEAFLPQIVDRTIWLEYPPLSQDIKALLWGASSALAQTHISSGMTIMESLPVGDSTTTFCFARFRVDVFLMEQGRDSQRLYLPCFLTIVRPATQTDIMFILTSQNGAVQLRVSSNKNIGPVWEDVRWQSDKCGLEVRLPRGFLLYIQCQQQAFSTLRSMYEFTAKVHSSLYPRQDEMCVFRSTLRAFQYFDNDPQSRQFPKESTPNCEVALFERLYREGAATGPRTYHRGFRIAVVTGPRTKTLSGVNQTYAPNTPIQFGFLRSEANDPALSLKFDNGRFKGNMVLSFKDESERFRMHSLLIGTALDRGEAVYGEAQINGAWFSERYGDTLDNGLKALSSVEWNKLRVINHDNDGENPSCVLADRLRVVYKFKEGTLTDRVNVAPGELKLRLDVKNPTCLMLFRQPQSDITLAITEASSSPALATGLSQALEILKKSPSIRTYQFPSLKDLHVFQQAITGFEVLFDGTACAFAIARRRMVVPIHKKWEAGTTRIQVVHQDGVYQLLAFFEDFSHGQCMGFQIKGTDVFEAISRSGKPGLKIDDAKFPLPKTIPPEEDRATVVADAAFLCLDLPELPGEHDDITILFDSEAERDKLVGILPAQVKSHRLTKPR